jgi:N-methylhydantoinase A
MGYRVGIDSGGTFTDLQAIGNDGDVIVLKVSSTPSDPAIGVRNALDALLQQLGGDAAQIQNIVHGTTVAVNAVLQRRFPKIGLLVTDGFRHILELARQTVPGERGSIYVWVKPPRIVPLCNVREVTERATATGKVISELDEQECREAARWFRDQDINTVAICFINAYANGEHERRSREIFREEHPDCFISLSCETLPEFREYERAVTTCMNSLLMPLLGKYVTDLQEHLAALGIDAPLYIMKSGGGASRADVAVEQPVYTALSGPAASVMGAVWVGKHAGLEDMLTFDMGGTSTDVSLVEGAQPTLVSETELDIYPLRTPCIDVVSVGAGGGSIAWLAPGDRLAVGPRSAGADPGPACYGRGGKEPTITDANLLLGRLPPTLAGGQTRLDRSMAEQALERLGERIGLAPLALADGIVRIAELSMADAIRSVSVQKGRDPRRFTLIASGGAGPLHAASLGEILKIPRVVVPVSPGIGCSLGALVSDVREDFVVTDLQREANPDFERIRDNFQALEVKARDILQRQGFSEERCAILRSADLRYRGMRTELTVSVAAGELDESAILEIFHSLHQAHESAYGYSYAEQQQVELVNFRVAGLARMPAVTPNSGRASDSESEVAVVERNQVYFGEDNWLETPFYDRERLATGMRLQGPAVVLQYDSTTVILPGQAGEIDLRGNLVIATTHATNTGRVGREALSA